MIKYNYSTGAVSDKPQGKKMKTSQKRAIWYAEREKRIARGEIELVNGRYRRVKKGEKNA